MVMVCVVTMVMLSTLVVVPMMMATVLYPDRKGHFAALRVSVDGELLMSLMKSNRSVYRQRAVRLYNEAAVITVENKSFAVCAVTEAHFPKPHVAV